MPIITFPYKALEGALARGALRPPPDRATVVLALRAFGCAIEGSEQADPLSVEALMNRPDLFSVEGIARALRPFLGLSAPPAYRVVEGALALSVDPSVLDIRPAISCAVVRGVDLDADSLRLLLETQEKLDLTYGRKRTRVSIGLHDLRALAPPLTYKAVAPDAASFVPLFAESLTGGARALTLGQVLDLHPKGVEYAAILRGKPRYPLLVDSAGAVLSMPPIINGKLTELKVGRADIFLDVTGTAKGPVDACARLLAMLLADRGGAVESVAVTRPSPSAATREPDLRPALHRVDLARASSLVGAGLRAGEAAAALERMGHRVSVVPGGLALEVSVPAWRFDILHEVDLTEDIAIGLGYAAVPGRLPCAPTLGAEEPLASLKRRARSTLLGLGFLEVTTLTLTSPEGARMPLAAPAPAPACVANPITRDHSVLRASLLPSLLAVFGANTSRDLPQAIFEVGDAVVGGKNAPRLAAAYTGGDASFTRAKGVAANLMESLGLPLDVEPADTPPFATGRCARALVLGAPAGAFGEVAPAALAHFSLVHPAIALEFSLDILQRP